MSFLLRASQCPAPAVYGSFLSIPVGNTSGGNAPIGTGMSSGDMIWSAPFNELQARTANLARYGGGCYGVGEGMGLSTAASLNLPVALGHVVFDGVREFATTTIASLPDNTANIVIWAQQNGTYTYRTTTAVVANAVCIGNVTTSGGHITAVDYSGVVYLGGQGGERTVADLGMPTDTPPAAWRGWTIGADGIRWWWDGSQYQMLSNGLALSESSIPAGQSKTIPAGFQLAIERELDIAGTLTVAGDLYVR